MVFNSLLVLLISAPTDTDMDDAVTLPVFVLTVVTVAVLLSVPLIDTTSGITTTDTLLLLLLLLLLPVVGATSAITITGNVLLALLLLLSFVVVLVSGGVTIIVGGFECFPGRDGDLLCLLGATDGVVFTYELTGINISPPQSLLLALPLMSESMSDSMSESMSE